MHCFIKSQLSKHLLKFFGIISLYMALTGSIVFPIFSRFSTSIIGTGDSVQNLWNLWWVGGSIRNGNWFPFQTNFLYYPMGVSLAFHPLEPLNGWLGFLFQTSLKLNLYAAFNLLVIFTFLLTGLSTYWLAYHLSRHQGASLAASIIFTFAPIRMSRVFFGNLEMYSTYAIPLCFLFLIRMKQSRHWIDGALGAIFLALIIYTSLYLALGTALLCGTLLLWDMVSNFASFSQLKITLRNWTVIAVVVLILSLPVLLPMLQNYNAFLDQTDMTTASISNSADLLGFFVPDSINLPELKLFPQINNLVDKIHAHYVGNPAEKTVYLGWSVIFLSLLPFFTPRLKEIKFWGIGVCLFFLFCLGPIPHILGKAISIPLFYSVLTKIPLISFGRAPSRFAILLMFCLSMWVAYGLASLTKKYPKLHYIPWLAAGIIFLEFFPSPVPLDLRTGRIPAYYYTIAADPNINHAVLDIPIDLYGAQGPGGEYMLYQTIHQKPITSGYISRTPNQVMQLLNTDFLKNLHARIYGDQTPYEFDSQTALSGLKDICKLQAEYVILHKDQVSQADAEILFAGLQQVLNEPVMQDQTIIAWQVSRLKPGCLTIQRDR